MWSSFYSLFISKTFYKEIVKMVFWLNFLPYSIQILLKENEIGLKEKKNQNMDLLWSFYYDDFLIAITCSFIHAMGASLSRRKVTKTHRFQKCIFRHIYFAHFQYGKKSQNLIDFGDAYSDTPILHTHNSFVSESPIPFFSKMYSEMYFCNNPNFKIQYFTLSEVYGDTSSDGI